jgi:hypothetical protein
MFKTAFATIAIGLATAASAHALPVAGGSFTLSPAGGTPIAVDTGDITLDTASRTVAAWQVSTVAPNLDLALSNGLPASFSSTTLLVPPGTGTSVPVSFTLDAGALTFSFASGVTNSRVALAAAAGVAGSFSDQFAGTLANGGGVFEAGAPVTLSETCTQPAVAGHAGLINCGDAVVTVGHAIPEPNTLALIGAALFGFLLLRRTLLA